MGGFQVELRAGDGRRKFLTFPPKASSIMTKAWERGAKRIDVQLVVNGHDNVYTMDFVLMLQINKDTGKSRKIRAPTETSTAYNNAADVQEAEGVSGEDGKRAHSSEPSAHEHDEVERELARQMTAKAPPPPPEVKIDPKLDKRKQIKSQFEAQKENPTSANIEKLLKEGKEAGTPAAEIKEMEKFLVVVKDLEEKMKNQDVDNLANSVKACEDAGAGKNYTSNAMSQLESFKIMKGRKLIGKMLEDTKDQKGQDMETLEKWKVACTEAILVILLCGLGEEEVRPVRDRMRKVHNGIQDLRGAIRVFARTRPPNQRELDLGFKPCCVFDPDRISVKLFDEDGADTKFQFDATFCPGTQWEVFLDLKELVQSVYDGYNVTVFAYGQTGAGKTFTMYGPVEGMEALDNPNAGCVINAIKEIFILADGYKKTSQVHVEVCMIELYCSKLNDLMHDGQSKPETINVRRTPEGEVLYENAIWKPTKDARELWGAVHNGFASRQVSATAMNATSSRSHLILTIKVELENRATKAKIKGKVTLVDLAGSERVKDSMVEGKALDEAIEINKSLTVLGDVMQQLASPKKGAINYRNSKLTELLQDSLGGTAKTLMFANVSPAMVNQSETMMTLKWAQRANKVTNTGNVIVDDKSAAPDPKAKAKGKVKAKAKR